MGDPFRSRRSRCRRPGGRGLIDLWPSSQRAGVTACGTIRVNEERFDYKILNDKSFTETVRVPAAATLYGNQRLGPRNGSQNERITLARLVARASGDARRPVAVWLKRGSSGAVVYLAEQYLP
jgi:hypothetical protein